jgi:pyrroloquinoline-quinone synthase
MEDCFDTEAFWRELHARIGNFDLLKHPYYQAWSAGELTRQDLRQYAAEYYAHVAAFPTYLSALHCRLPDGELRRAVLRNLSEEEIVGRPHSELWLDFAEAMGAERDDVMTRASLPEVCNLVQAFRDLAQHGSVAEALAGFYAYESQVPRIADAKLCGLEQYYAADAKATTYFQLHRTADVHHAAVWRDLLTASLREHPETAPAALAAAETAAAALWRALDGIEENRQVAA